MDDTAPSKSRASRRPRQALPEASAKLKSIPAAEPIPGTAGPLTDLEVRSVQQIARGDALRKFFRGSPLSFADACSFWGFTTSSHPETVRTRIKATGDLLKRAMDAAAKDTVDLRLPRHSTCYGLFNLHRLMTERFQREIEALQSPST